MAKHINKEFTVVHIPATKSVFLTKRSWQKIPWQDWDEDDLDEEYGYLAERTYLFSICDRPVFIR